MAYEESKIECDWCGKPIDDGGECACRKCYEELEEKCADQEKEIEQLTNKIEGLENEIAKLS